MQEKPDTENNDPPNGAQCIPSNQGSKGGWDAKTPGALVPNGAVDRTTSRDLTVLGPWSLALNSRQAEATSWNETALVANYWVS